MYSLLKSLYFYRELLWNLVIRNLKIRYKNSALGFLWTLLNPLFLIFIYYFFIRLMRFQMNLAELLSGVIPWHFLSMTLGDSVETISGNSTLVTKIRFPRIILPLSTVLANLVNYLLSLAVLILCLPLLQGGISVYLFWLLPLLPLQFIFVLGLSLIVSTCNVYFKDTGHLLSVAMMAWFFLTPIIYPLTQIPVAFRDLAFLNPMTSLVCLYRLAFLQVPLHFNVWILSSGIILFLVFFLGYRLFSHFEPIFADEL
ncbi:MAG: ABC transporter permease [Candidatus Aureabacteria bacterium]|nr:ABC transporter permease [Candidatus Auribacterota bacterium]